MRTVDNDPNEQRHRHQQTDTDLVLLAPGTSRPQETERSRCEISHHSHEPWPVWCCFYVLLYVTLLSAPGQHCRAALYKFITPPPVGTGSGVLFSLDFFLSFFLSFFVCIFVSLSARLRENGWTDLHEIFREGVEWPWDDLIQFWVNSDKRVAPKNPKTPK